VRYYLLALSFSIISFLAYRPANAASLQLAWTDNSQNESGFNIERKLGTAGTFSLIATVGVNTTSYLDSNLADATSYCYRVNAFNSAGSSPYTPEVCGTTAAPPPVTYGLTVSVQGGGSVVSSPAAINCGSSCLASFTSGTSVILQALPATGYSFAGWSGDADCSDGSVTMNTNKTCMATFQSNVQKFTLAVSTVGSITAAGAGSGKIVSNPVGIDCGSSCSASYANGTGVTLTAIPAPGSVFAGWSGDSDCSDGSVSMNINKSCTASFKISTYTLTVGSTGTGTGKLTSTPTGIDCGASCSASFAIGASVKLIATPDSGSSFDGWTGDPDCSDGSVSMNASKSCAAVFTQTAVSNVGLFRPSTGEWFLTKNKNEGWYGCTIDSCLGPFGKPGDVPVVGDWKGSGKTLIGIFNPLKRLWELDVNGTGSSSSCGTGTCLVLSFNAGSTDGQIPISGNWDGLAGDLVGVYQGSSSKSGQGNRQTNSSGYWYLDLNGNGVWDGCQVDRCLGPFGASGDIPVVGDWDGTGIVKIGIYDPSHGTWQLDLNGNGKWDGCKVDKCITFGQKGDIPVVGDWNASGTAKIGVFRPTTGEWWLDLNGNGKWEGCNVDKCLTGFGQPGDLPVVGNW